MSTTDSDAGYPPVRHVLRDLDITTEYVAAKRSLSAAPVGDAVRDSAGRASLGFLAALTDVNSAMVALVSGQPDWTATISLSLHLTGVVPGAAVVTDSRLVRAGSNIVVVHTSVWDAAGDADEVFGHLAADDEPALPCVATGLLTFARIPRHASRAASTFDPGSMVGQRRRMTGDEPTPSGSLTDWIGLRVIDPVRGIVELDRADYVRNSFGTINGGVVGMIVQPAAELAVPGYAATDLEIQYLAQAKVGPARTLATVVRRTDHGAACDVRLVDAGNDDLLLALATVGLLRAA